MTTRTFAASTLLATFLLAGVAIADEDNSSSSSSSASSNSEKKNKKTIDLACVQGIIGKRDDAVLSAFATFSASMTQAFTTRRDALVSAWGMEDRKERKKALEAAWKAFKSSRKTAEKTFKEGKKAAWKTFNADRKTCRGSPDEMRDHNEGE
ncbi:MAG: hypothetical protein AAB853_04945 [Patescibacteria group bacterium]